MTPGVFNLKYLSFYLAIIKSKDSFEILKESDF